MIMISWLSLMVVTISMALIIINTIISKKSFSDREKSSPFECGFDPKNKARMPFSLHFFLITVVFLIFDVEITLLMPMIYAMTLTSIVSFSVMFSYFIIILLVGVYHEWNQGALSWTK